MQRFVSRALFKMTAPFDILSVLLGRNGYGRNGYWWKWFWAENVQMTSDAFVFNYAPVLARVLTQNGRLKNKDAIFVCLNFYATVRCKKALSERQLQGMPRSAARRFFETYLCVGKRCKTFRSAPLMQRTPETSRQRTTRTLSKLHSTYIIHGGGLGQWLGVGFRTKGSLVRAPAGALFVVALSKSHLPHA